MFGDGTAALSPSANPDPFDLAKDINGSAMDSRTVPPRPLTPDSAATGGSTAATFRPRTTTADAEFAHVGLPEHGEQYGLKTARSRHPNGVNLLLCDGSVHFVANGISLATWRAVATPRAVKLWPAISTCSRSFIGRPAMNLRITSPGWIKVALLVVLGTVGIAGGLLPVRRLPLLARVAGLCAGTVGSHQRGGGAGLHRFSLSALDAKDRIEAPSLTADSTGRVFLAWGSKTGETAPRSF